MRAVVVKGFFLIIALWFLLFGLMSVFPVNPSASSGGGGHYGRHDLFGGLMGGGGGGEDTTEILHRIDAALKEIHDLRRNNAEMKRLIGGGGSSNNVNNDIVPGHHHHEEEDVPLMSPGDPSFTYEDTRRQLELNLNELWYNVRSKADHLEEIDSEQIRDIYKSLKANLKKLRQTDGFESFRRRETQDLASIVQSRLRTLQNPPNCDKAKKLVCSLNKGCGFGCQVHHVCYCLVVAYATGRTLILESRGWRYNRGGWDKVFKPLSDTCTDNTGESRGDWSGLHSETQVLQLPIVDFLKPRPPFLPVSIPSDLSSRLEKVHGEPHIWWVGQFMKYVLRPQPEVESMINDAREKSQLKGPVVGLHVRRTDKIGTEASYHNLKEYMDHAEEYFSILERAEGGSEDKEALVKRVFIASDDPSVIAEAKKAYPLPEWEILGDTGVAQSAALSQRYNGLNGIIRDVFLLSECDFLVCTFSSQVCRLAYELFQTKHADASNRFVSLDDVYYYGGGIGLDQEAILAHKARNSNELDLQVGDKIAIAGNHWNGLSKGTNRRTNKIGLYPSYKAKNLYTKIKFPEKEWWTR